MLGLPLNVYFKNLKNEESLMTSTRNVVKQIPNGLKILNKLFLDQNVGIVSSQIFRRRWSKRRIDSKLSTTSLPRTGNGYRHVHCWTAGMHYLVKATFM